MRPFWPRLFTLNAKFLIRQLEALFPGPPIGAAILFHTKGRTTMSVIEVKDDETTLRSTLALLDKEGHVTASDTTPTWESSDETVAVIAASEDGLTATYEIGGPGDAVITVDTGAQDDNGNNIVGKGTIHVTPGNVATVSIEFETG